MKAFKHGYSVARTHFVLHTVKDLCTEIATFVEDPPDSEFQKGFLLGLAESLVSRLQQENMK